MSKSQLKIDALNTGFEKILLFDESHEEIDAPPVIKTPLGNYLVCYTKLDTVLLTPEIFGSWSRRHGAANFAALDEVVEEVYDVQFCLRFASEINEVISRGKQVEAPAGVTLPDMPPTGDADVEEHIPDGGFVKPESGVVQTPEELMCLHNRTVADAYICMGTTGGLGFENPDAPVHTSLIQQYSKMVANGRVSCSNLRHVHVSDRRNVFYELAPGLDTSPVGMYKVNLSAVVCPQQPKDPCSNSGIPLPSWSSKESNVFDSKELDWIHSRWDDGLVPARSALCKGDEAWKEFLSREHGQERLPAVRLLLQGAWSGPTVRVTGAHWRNLEGQVPQELAYKAYGRNPRLWEPS